MNSIKSNIKGYKKQQGMVLVLVTASLLLLFGFAAFSLDVNHTILNKSRLQNSVDAAALSGALLLVNGKTNAEVTTAINTTLTTISTATGNAEMDMGSASITVFFSNDPQTFPDPSYVTTGDTYVRVKVSNMPLANYFVQMFGINKTVSASAVAGPSAALTVVCNVVPVAVCADSSAGSGSTHHLGYNFGETYAIKMADQNQTTMGPGNFQLLDFGSGASDVRKGLAGDYAGCIDINNQVQTKPGASAGPVAQGVNTRLNIYSGGGVNSADYPPDIYVKQPSSPAVLENDGSVTQPSWGYSDYNSEVGGCPGASECTDGDEGRRILAVPLVDCSGSSGGTTMLDTIGLGCFFLGQQVSGSNSGNGGVIYGEFIEECTAANGSTGTSPTLTGPLKIVLYNDPLSEES